MRFIILIGILALLSSIDAGAANDVLYGTSPLVNFAIKDAATGKTTDAFGKAPQGYINYSRDGRMLVLIVGGNRLKPVDLTKVTDQERAELFKSCIAYGGTFAFDGKRVIHHVDISWNENWTGIDQVRNVTFEGNRLILSTNPMPSPIDGKMGVGILVWEKMK